jgi:predicted Rossmann fold nucleotide-binding protein DprA/Smf involved in DNA uptake
MGNNVRPIKRVVIAGCRDYTNYEDLKEYVDMCLSNIREDNEIVIVSGGAKGADSLGERYASENGFKVELHLADWDKYGRGAGPRRNKEMAEVSDFVICFWDGKSRGTKSMIEYAKQLNKPVRVKQIQKNGDV